MISEFRPAHNAVDAVRAITRRVRFSARRYANSVSILDIIGNLIEHPWFNGFKTKGIVIPDTVEGHVVSLPERSLYLSSPILFLARGHSGTTPLARILAAAGVYMGSVQDKNALNRTSDALYWIYGLQRTLVPKLFKPGVGCLVNEHIVTAVALECLRRHLGFYTGGPWGFKTCAGMFCHSLYRYMFPHAKYIYLIRDGRDLVLSDNGFFHLTHPFSRRQHWEYFKIITFGISNDIRSCPFGFPERPRNNDQVMRNRFWVQAKSWREHIRMMEHLREKELLSPNVHTIRYEELCRDPIPILEQLFCFLEIELTPKAKDFARQTFHTKSVGRWKQYKQHITDCNEDMEVAFASMAPELELLGYTEC